MVCVACGRGFHRECVKCKSGACHNSEEKDAHGVLNGTTTQEEQTKPKEPKKLRLIDPSSTGRKRAAKLYPIDSNAPCEWRNLRNCGGGRRPIIGCLDGFQKHRHHGPVKTTTRNELGNVHRICSACHVHWHELNDLIYVEEEYNLLPHQPVPATELEIVQNILDWNTGKMGQRYELASSHNHEKGKQRAAQNSVSSHSSDEGELGTDDSLFPSIDG